SSSSPLYNSATLGSGTWTYSFPSTNFPGDGVYIIQSQAKDSLNKVQATLATATITISNVALTSTITSPTDGTTYTNSTWDAATPIAGTATPTGGHSLTTVGISILDVSANKYWNGTSFGSSTEVFNIFTGGTASTWTYAFPSSNFTHDGTYVIHSQAKDDG